MHLHPLRAIAAEAHHLHELEAKGENGATPFIALAELAVFVIVPVVLVVCTLAFVAAYVIG